MGIEFALQGAEVTGIEGREANLAKARFAQDTLGLTNYPPILGGVRNLASLAPEPFDVVPCAGILYHLEAGDAAGLLGDVAAACRRVAVIDTHFSLEERERFDWEGEAYWGRTVESIAPTPRPKRSRRRYGSRSITQRVPLHARFAGQPAAAGRLHLGVRMPRALRVLFRRDGRIVERPDRIVLVTIKGDPVGVISSPLTDTTRELKQPERSAFQARHAVFERAGRKLHRLVTRLVRKTGPLTQLAPRSWRNRPNWPGATGSGAGGKTDN